MLRFFKKNRTRPVRQRRAWWELPGQAFVAEIVNPCVKAFIDVFMGGEGNLEAGSGAAGFDGWDDFPARIHNSSRGDDPQLKSCGYCEFKEIFVYTAVGLSSMNAKTNERVFRMKFAGFIRCMSRRRRGRDGRRRRWMR